MAKEKKEYEDKTKELVEKLEKGILDTLNSEHYKNFLKFQSQFHSYSFNNQLLIYLQKSDATQVAGFKSWEKFERHVMKGEKGISILAPNPYKYKAEVEKVDSKTGEITKENVDKQRMSFRKVSVFDVSQTDGKELPDICKELQGNSVSAENIIKAIKKISEVPVIEKVIESGAKGYYSRLEDLIAINEGMSLDQTAKTLIHEYTHSKLHNTEAASLWDRATKEVQAESVAYIVSNRFGVDTSEYSFDYLANWSSGKELTELKQSLSLIQKTADNIITKMEGVLNKELELQNHPVKITIDWTESAQLEKGQTFSFEEASELLERLDSERQELRKDNDQYDYSKLTAGETLPYVSYEKTNIIVELSDGRTAEARFDLGESGYNTLADCIKNECKIDVEKYIEQHEDKLIEKEFDKVSESGSLMQDYQETTDDLYYSQIIKDKIVSIYTKELPAIKNISEKTASVIENLNNSKGQVHTIKEIKALHNNLGKKLEANYNKDDMQEFKTLNEVVDDLKQAKLRLKQEQAGEKTLENIKSRAMDMVQ